MAAATPKSTRVKVQEHRARLRKEGLRPIQIWAPDVRSPAFRTAAHRQFWRSPAAPKHAATRRSSTRSPIGAEAGCVRRGEIWTVSSKDYAGKPRPVVIVGDRIGRLDEEDVVRLNRAAIVFLGLAASTRTSRKKG
jgi:hypothetical protein